ncbi:MAG: PHP domain-containing protein [Gemmatimonadales bacterium]|nr:PHP domain-containing protein [Gemmatimonadales bacterium]
MTIDKSAVSRVLDQIASYLELKGDNPFKVRAFRMGARTVTGLAGEPAQWLTDGTLEQAHGIGAGIQAVVRDLVQSGRSTTLDELREEVPPGLVEMLRISGLGVTKVRQIHERLHLESIPELEGAARDGRLASLPGFGPKTAENVLKGISRLRQASTYRLIHHATDEAAALRSALERVPGVTAAVVAGEVRRGLELVQEVVIVLVADHPPEDVLKAIAKLPGVDEFGGHDERRATVRFAGGESCQVVVTPSANLGAVLIQATGGERHLADLVARAAERGCTLRGAALWRGSEFVPTPDEAAVYQALGLEWVPPELREGTGEVAAAATGLPALVSRPDLRGLIHCHTSYSDGSFSVRDLATVCGELGYRYVGVTDHSGTAAYVGGLSEADIRLQWAEIDAANAEGRGARVLKGIEADILADGRLGYPDELLAGFDFVIASVHNRFEMNREQMTARFLTAMENPYVTILGHLTGRLLLSRDPYQLDVERLFAKAAERMVAIEINADPQRLDLDWRLVRQARAAGVQISIGADAHSRAGLDNVDYGVLMARKAWLTAADVLNARGVEGFLDFARKRGA